LYAEILLFAQKIGASAKKLVDFALAFFEDKWYN
jgi:hypothetical protein